MSNSLTKVDDVQRLIEKSIEAFMMAIEVFNKPSIQYRAEGFSMFMCNAWELMLKAHLIKRDGESNIYYRDHPDRTISLENCIQKVFTNNKDPLRKNLERVAQLRNVSTHFITKEYEMVYIPVFQSCVLNFSNKLFQFHGIDITQRISQNFLTLPTSIEELNANEIRARYSSPVSGKLLNLSETIEKEMEENNAAYGIKIIHYDYLTKNRAEATDLFHIAADGEKPAIVIKELKNPNETHKYNATKCIEEINTRLKKKGLSVVIHMTHFTNIVKYYHLKDDQRFCYKFQISKTPQYGYSQQTIDFIVGEISKDPENILENIKQQLKQKS